MKEFRYSTEVLAGNTVTVKELMEALSKYPEDMPVMATWEGVHAFIDPELFSVEVVSKGHKEDDCDCLVINVN